VEKGLKDPLSDLCNSALVTLKGLGYPHAALFLKRGRKLELAASRGRLSVVKVTGRSLSRRMPSSAVFPLKSGRKSWGFLVLDTGGRAFSPGERELLGGLARLLGQALEALEKARQEGLVDSLTGVYNRNYMEKRLEEELARAQRKGRPFSLVLVDTHGLKEINDRYGHVVGDEALKAVARLFRENLRASDEVARYGGDEFVFLMSETLAQEAERAMGRLVDVFSHSRFSAGEEDYPLPAFGYGVATFPQDGEGPAQLLSAADQALGRAKAGQV
jgi:two-component system cell cycle response regulator